MKRIIFTTLRLGATSRTGKRSHSWLVSLLAVIAVAFGTSLATAGEAASAPAHRHRAALKTSHQVGDTLVAHDVGHGRRPGPKNVDLAHPPVNYLASSWCGSWLRGPMYCVNFNRSEQAYLSLASLTAATGFICLASLGVGCVVAGTVAAVAQRYIDNHGLCPSSKPILEVEYAPAPGGYAACSNG